MLEFIDPTSPQVHKGRGKDFKLDSKKQPTQIIIGGILCNVKESFGGSENSTEVPVVRRRKIVTSGKRITGPPQDVSGDKKPGVKYRVWLEEVPSENSLYPTNFKTGMRFLSKKGKEFKQRAVKAFSEANLPVFQMKPLVIEYIAYWRDMRRCDASNYIKAIGDALKSGGFIEDDWILLFRAVEFFYPDNPNRGLPKGIQGFMLTIFTEQKEV